MISGDIWRWTAGETVDAIRSRAVTVREIIESILQRVDSANPSVNALCTVVPDHALAAASSADQRLNRGAQPRLLEGVAFSAKDLIATSGITTTFGLADLRAYVPDSDAVAVERLKAHGAILIGKSNTSPYGFDPFSNTTNVLFGTTRNPWDLGRTAGGSSGGAAAAVMSGFGPVGIGTDWGGSIRLPAAHCGAVALRPCPGRIPGFQPQPFGEFVWDIPVEQVVAPMARCVADIGRVLEAVAGSDGRSPTSLPRTGVDYITAVDTPELKHKRIAVTVDFAGRLPVDPEVATAVREAAYALKSAGCYVNDDAPDISGLPDIVQGTRAFGLLLRFGSLSPSEVNSLPSHIAANVAKARLLTLDEVARSERLRSAYWSRMQEFLSRYDFLITPAAAFPPYSLTRPLIQQLGLLSPERYWLWLQFLNAVSVLGLPALAIPCAHSSAGLPIGMQIVGGQYSERSVLALGAIYEKLAGPFPWPPDQLSSEAPVVDPSFETGAVPI